MIEGESHSTRHISNQPHLMKDTQLDWTESDLQNSKSGGNQLTGGKKKMVTIRCLTAKNEIHNFSGPAVYCSLNIRTI